MTSHTCFCVRPVRHDDDQDGTNSEASFYDDGNTTRIHRRSSDSNTSSESGSGGGSSDSDGSSGGEEDERGDGDRGGKEYRVKPGSVMMARQEGPKFTIDRGNSTGASGHDEVCWQNNRRT